MVQNRCVNIYEVNWSYQFNMFVRDYNCKEDKFEGHSCLSDIADELTMSISQLHLIRPLKFTLKDHSKLSSHQMNHYVLLGE